MFPLCASHVWPYAERVRRLVTSRHHVFAVGAEFEHAQADRVDGHAGAERPAGAALHRQLLQPFSIRSDTRYMYVLLYSSSSPLST